MNANPILKFPNPPQPQVPQNIQNIFTLVSENRPPFDKGYKNDFKPKGDRQGPTIPMQPNSYTTHHQSRQQNHDFKSTSPQRSDRPPMNKGPNGKYQNSKFSPSKFQRDDKMPNDGFKKQQEHDSPRNSFSNRQPNSSRKNTYQSSPRNDGPRNQRQNDNKNKGPKIKSQNSNPRAQKPAHSVLDDVLTKTTE